MRYITAWERRIINGDSGRLELGGVYEPALAVLPSRCRPLFLPLSLPLSFISLPYNSLPFVFILPPLFLLPSFFISHPSRFYACSYVYTSSSPSSLARTHSLYLSLSASFTHTRPLPPPLSPILPFFFRRSSLIPFCLFPAPFFLFSLLFARTSARFFVGCIGAGPTSAASCFPN
jgi:hypothetical protein